MSNQSSTNEIPVHQLKETLHRAQAGKEEAFTRLYDHYFERIYRFIYFRVSHKELAEDLTEDVFVKVFQSLKTLEQAERFESWLYQIARNKVIDHYRSKKVLVPLDEVEHTLEYETNIVDVVDLQTKQKLFIKLLRELTPEQQTVIKLKFLEDLDNETIAAMLNKQEGAIRVIQHRAITKLKELIEALDTNT